MPNHILIALGTRPECVKLAPVAKALQARPEQFRVTVCSTGQHREMLQTALKALELNVDEDLAVMRPNQTLSELTARLMTACTEVIARRQPDWVLVQGDTTTAFVAALAAFYARVRVGHVEAGLRTGSRTNPFPEEINRRLVAPLADLHFAPTPRAADNLRGEGIDPSLIHMTGNTVVDALLMLGARTHQQPPAGIPAAVLEHLQASRPLALITCHRRENFGPDLENICHALRRLASQWPQVCFVFPVHLNPNVRAAVLPILSGIANLHLIDPLAYDAMVFLMRHATLILTDSGGIQEEAPTFGVPVLVLRKVTERMESVDAGFSRLVGSDQDSIVNAAHDILAAGGCPELRERPNPYGDGHAAERIADILAEVQSAH